MAAAPTAVLLGTLPPDAASRPHCSCDLLRPPLAHPAPHAAPATCSVRHPPPPPSSAPPCPSCPPPRALKTLHHRPRPRARPAVPLDAAPGRSARPAVPVDVAASRSAARLPAVPVHAATGRPAWVRGVRSRSGRARSLRCPTTPWLADRRLAGRRCPSPSKQVDRRGSAAFGAAGAQIGAPRPFHCRRIRAGAWPAAPVDPVAGGSAAGPPAVTVFVAERPAPPVVPLLGGLWFGGAGGVPAPVRPALSVVFVLRRLWTGAAAGAAASVRPALPVFVFFGRQVTHGAGGEATPVRPVAVLPVVVCFVLV